MRQRVDIAMYLREKGDDAELSELVIFKLLGEKLSSFLKKFSSVPFHQYWTT